MKYISTILAALIGVVFLSCKMPKDPCLTNNGGCDTNATCTADGSLIHNKVWAVCACKPGYSGSGQAGQCAAIDSCTINNGGCDINGICTSTGPGTNTCSCKPGYEGNGQAGRCAPINSCLTNHGGCDVNATCTSTGPGTNTCSCNTGYIGDGKTCCQTDKANWLLPSESPAYNLTDGTATDTRTGLTWQRVISTTGVNSWADAKAYCENLDLEGLVWRLPTAIEFFSTVDWAKNAPAVDTAVFTNTPSSNLFYTSSLDLRCSNCIKTIRIEDGVSFIGGITTTVPYYVRCVNDYNIVPVCGYNIETDTAYDKATHLLWERATSSSPYSLANAETYCSSLNLGGFNSGWRLPTIMELLSLVNDRVVYPSIDVVTFPNTSIDNSYRTSTIVFSHGDYRYIVYFGSGTSNYGYNDDMFFVRCVRDV